MVIWIILAAFYVMIGCGVAGAIGDGANDGIPAWNDAGNVARRTVLVFIGVFWPGFLARILVALLLQAIDD